ncbi:DUF805 domain-containing protein [Methylobacterium brachythecii]|uniref:Uncharacterized membrane protein YhaH (DUF805 family) n=1 Tax=Methylobacterium brachythecii TaxID=1176177 RepID=A0A7W6AQ95_9HYPH|nr:DUF805 domain-containing protein [Methylobacterium brachythecii]MBB3903857.1 uncharacterized membrane protein YhaH (DUF805 family) [Methylobacterium brachythecii]
MSPLHWFDPRGRLSRRAYGRRAVRLGLLTAALACLSVALAAQGWRVAGLLTAGGALLPGLAAFAQTVRRLHDRGRTGLWLALPLAQTALGFVPIEDQAEAHPAAVLTYALAALAAGLWFLIETLGRHGMTGPNRYGPEEANGRGVSDRGPSTGPA